VRHHRHHDVQLEVAAAPRDGDRRVVPHHPGADHHQRLAITGLTLPGMIELPGWIAGSVISQDAGGRPLASHRTSSAIFIRHGERVERPGRAHGRVLRALRLEVVVRLAEGEAGRLR
jgi:hypothetical protein